MKPFLFIFILLTCLLCLPSPLDSGWSDSIPSWSGSSGTTDDPGADSDPQTTIIETSEGSTIVTLEETTEASRWSKFSNYGSGLSGGGGGGGGDQCSVLSMIGLTPGQMEGQLNDVLNETVAGVLRNLNNTINPILEQVVNGVREELEQIKSMTAGLKDDLIYEVKEIKNETIGLVKDVVSDVLELLESLRDKILSTVENTIDTASNLLDKLKFQVVDIEKGLVDMVKNMTDQLRDGLLKDTQLIDDIGKITADLGKLIQTTISNIATEENQASLERVLTQLDFAIKGQSKSQDASLEAREKEEDHAQKTVQKAQATAFGAFDIMGIIASLLELLNLDNEFVLSRLGILLLPWRIIFDPSLLSPYVIWACDFVIDTINDNEEFWTEQVRQMAEVFFQYLQGPGSLVALVTWVKNTFKINLNFNWNHDTGYIG